MNPYRHALDTMQYALNDNGGLAWLKHNQRAVLKALTICDTIETLVAQGHKVLGIYDDGESLPVSPIHEIQVDAILDGFNAWHDAQEQN